MKQTIYLSQKKAYYNHMSNVAMSHQPMFVQMKSVTLSIYRPIVIQQSGSYSSFLSIEYATPQHNGNYTCIVTNEGATTSHTSQLHINGNDDDDVMMMAMTWHEDLINIQHHVCLHPGHYHILLWRILLVPYFLREGSSILLNSWAVVGNNFINY